uniref:Uncharacterized protein n=1 Tax=Trichogramma kaykai TaxID=54128 RepID=A0ABD2WAJ8_9HYME
MFEFEASNESISTVPGTVSESVVLPFISDKPNFRKSFSLVSDASINCLSTTMETLSSSIVLIFFAFTSQGSSDFFFLLFSAPRIGIDLLCRLSSISGSR